MSDVFNKCHRCQTPGKDLRRCTGCYTVYYCSKQCHRSDWDTHKTTCQTTTKGPSLSDTATRTAIQIEQVFGTASEKTDGNEDEEINMNEVANDSEKAGAHVPSTLDVYQNCHHCQTDAENLRSCTGCYTVYYCSKQCQRSDWTSHKRACRGSANESAIHSTSTTTSPDEGMNTDNALPTFKAANQSIFELHGNKQTGDFMVTSNSEKSENEASRDKSGKKFKGVCFACRTTFCTMMCAKCKVVVYCSKACQKEDWHTHKKYCKKVNDAGMPTKNSPLTNAEIQIIEYMKVREQRFNEANSREKNIDNWNFSGPFERIFATLTPGMLTIYERPFGSFTKALRMARTRYPGWNQIYKFDNIPGEVFPKFQKRYMRNVLVAFMFMYHDHVTRHAVFLKDIQDSITHVEFYLDHLGDNPLPKFSYADVTPGNYILIQNPLMHQFMDGQVGLRIDDPSDVHICSIDILPK